MKSLIKNLQRVAHYTRYSLTHRGLSDYVDMGLGMEARYERCSSYWEPHLRCCKELQLAALAQLPQAKSIAVLGSGGLRDFAWEEITKQAKQVEQIDCYDCDPGAKLAWQSHAQKFPVSSTNFYQIELTGVMLEWTERLSEFLKSRPVKDILELENWLNELAAPVPKLESRYDIVISLNILSQIHIHWRDRMAASLLKYWKLESDDDGRYPSSLQAAMNRTFKQLELMHLELLFSTALLGVIVISDQEWLYYKPQNSLWRSEQALQIDLKSELTDRASAKLEQTSWLWHIAPCGIEEKEYGVIHDVGGYSLLV